MIQSSSFWACAKCRRCQQGDFYKHNTCKLAGTLPPEFRGAECNKCRTCGVDSISFFGLCLCNMCDIVQINTLTCRMHTSSVIVNIRDKFWFIRSHRLKRTNLNLTYISTTQVQLRAQIYDKHILKILKQSIFSIWTHTAQPRNTRTCLFRQHVNGEIAEGDRAGKCASENKTEMKTRVPQGAVYLLGHKCGTQGTVGTAMATKNLIIESKSTIRINSDSEALVFHEHQGSQLENSSTIEIRVLLKCCWRPARKVLQILLQTLGVGHFFKNWGEKITWLHDYGFSGPPSVSTSPR